MGGGSFKCYVTQVGLVKFSGKKRYEGVPFNDNVISPGPFKRYVTSAFFLETQDPPPTPS